MARNYKMGWVKLNKRSVTVQDILITGLGAVIVAMGTWSLFKLVMALGVWALNPDLGWEELNRLLGY